MVSNKLVPTTEERRLYLPTRREIVRTSTALRVYIKIIIRKVLKLIKNKKQICFSILIGAKFIIIFIQ